MRIPDFATARAKETLRLAPCDASILVRLTRSVSSRGRLNPRGVKHKMSNFNIRRRGMLPHQAHQPVPVLRI